MAECILPRKSEHLLEYRLSADARLNILAESGCAQPPNLGMSKITTAEIEARRIAFIAMHGNEFGQID